MLPPISATFAPSKKIDFDTGGSQFGDVHTGGASGITESILPLAMVGVAAVVLIYWLRGRK